MSEWSFASLFNLFYKILSACYVQGNGGVIDHHPQSCHRFLSCECSDVFMFIWHKLSHESCVNMTCDHSGQHCILVKTIKVPCCFEGYISSTAQGGYVLSSTSPSVAHFHTSCALGPVDYFLFSADVGLVITLTHALTLTPCFQLLHCYVNAGPPFTPFSLPIGSPAANCS